MPSPCIPSRRGKARVGLIANTAAAGLVLGANRPGHGEDKRPLLYKPMRFVRLLFLASRFAPKIWQEVRVMTRTFPSYRTNAHLFYKRNSFSRTNASSLL